MDKSWMHADGRSKKYDEGVEEFLRIGLMNATDPNFIKCPCKKCENTFSRSVRVVREHLCFNGVDKTNKNWIWHGEPISSNGGTSKYDDSYEEEESKLVDRGEHGSGIGPNRSSNHVMSARPNGEPYTSLLGPISSEFETRIRRVGLGQFGFLLRPQKINN